MMKFWSGSMEVRCPWHDGAPAFLVYPDVAQERVGYGGVVEIFVCCPTCPTTAWIRPSAQDGSPFAVCVMPNRETKVHVVATTG
jgi:hypothetical protein